MKKSLCIMAAFIVLFGSAVRAVADDDIGKIVALRGKAVIERKQKAVEARLKDGVWLIDTIATGDASKTKMLFIDDSILTVGENSRVAIKEFVYGKEDRGRAIFNLLDGKMRSVVGKTNFEVHTPTLVAAARGTVIFFETGIEEGIRYTTVVCIEGEVDIRSIDPSVTGRVVLKPGMMINVKQGGALPAAGHAPATAIQAAAMTGEAAPPLRGEALSTVAETLRTLTSGPQIQQLPQQLPQLRGTPVNIGIGFTAPVNVGIVFP